METISVVIPTFYRNSRLREAIESVSSDAFDVEVIVVDGSTEEHAREVVRAYDTVEYVPQETDDGPHAAREAGVEFASGEYVQFLDDDDRIRPGKFEKQVTLLEDSPSVGVAYTGIVYESGRVELPDPNVRRDVLEYALSFYPTTWMTSSLLIERELVEELRPFENCHGADDMGMRIELAKRTHFEFVDEPLVYAGEPAGSLGKSWQSIDGRKEVLEKYASLYDEFPPEVRRAARAELYRRTGRRYLDDRVWSPSAILSFARSIYHEPDPSMNQLGEVVAAVGGRPGHRIANYVRKVV